MAQNPHDGHRQRMLEKLRRFGLDVFSDHEVLELLLYFSVRQADTNPIAHRLMQRFGSLHAVFEAPAEQLQEVEGVGPRSADLIKLTFAAFARYQADVAQAEQYASRLNSAERIGAYFVPQFLTEREEVLLVAYLDGAGRVIRCEETGRGGLSHVRVDIGKICRNALLSNAAGVAMAHNHPNGQAVPSQDDISVTRVLEDQLRNLDIELLDHCVVARGQYYSMRGNRIIGQRRG